MTTPPVTYLYPPHLRHNLKARASLGINNGLRLRKGSTTLSGLGSLGVLGGV